MNRILVLIFILLFALQQDNKAQTGNVRICHSVVFKLRHAPGSSAEKDFLEALLKLAKIPEVENLHLANEISRKNNYDFFLSMEFANQGAYDRYNNHPDHVAFVQQRWLKEVEDFLEIDFPLEN